MTLTRTNPRAKQRWAVLVVALVAGMLAFATLAQGFTQDQFELDKNATNGLTTEHLGVLKSKANAGVSTITVCQRQFNHDGNNATPPLVVPIPATPFDILIDNERRTVTGFGATVAVGGCSFSDPADSANTARVWNITPATAAAHPGGSDVTYMNDTGTDPAGDDWDDVYHSIQDDLAADPPITENHECADIGAVACSYAHDDFGVTVYTTGGSKDDLNVNPLAGEAGTGWKHTNSSVPPSDEILDAFAAKYVTGSGATERQLLYFGADRWSTNGAKDMGFWFFHDEISLNADGTFNGNHTRPSNGGTPGDPSDDTRGDILLLSTFTQGGAVTSIRVFEWVGVGGNTNGTLQSIGAFGDCVPGNTLDNGCNTVTNTTVPAPWPYQGAGSTQVSGVFYAGALAEGGIDLSALNLDGCFASFLAETRSSPEPGAQLKDFVLGSFESCESKVTTTPADGSGTALTDTDDPANDLPDTQIGTGAIGVDVTDTALVEVGGLTTWTGTIDFYLCGPISSGECTGTDGVFISTENVSDAAATATSDSANLTEVGRYCWRGEFKPSAASALAGLEGSVDASAGECFEVKPVTPTLTTTAWSSGDDTGSAQTDPVSFGDPLYDKATLGGTANQPGTDGAGDADGDYTSINATMDTEANGTITFTLVGPDGETTACDSVDDLAGALAGSTGTNPETVDVVDANDDPSGDGDYFTSGFTPDAPGDYHWKASYSGDSPNTLDTSHNDDCDETGEDVSVQQLQPTMDTAQNFIPNDEATVTVDAGAGDLDGDVTFYMWVDDDTCGEGDLSTADYTSVPALAISDTDDAGDTVLTDTVSSANTEAYGDDGTTFHWIAVFESNTSSHLDVTSGCGNEHSSITIVNGDTQPPATP